MAGPAPYAFVSKSPSPEAYNACYQHALEDAGVTFIEIGGRPVVVAPQQLRNAAESPGALGTQ